MSTMASARADPELLQRWRKQIASQGRYRERRGPRPWAAISILPRGPIHDGLIDIRHMLLLVLRDDRREDQSVVTFFSGYRSALIPWGVKIGSAEFNRFEKDLTIVPKQNARGRRWNLADAELFTQALELDRYLERRTRYPHWPRSRQPRWPCLWAAMPADVASQLCRNSKLDASTSNRGTASSQPRSMMGLALLPLATVSEASQDITTVFADLKTVPKRQLVSLDHPTRNLCGTTETIEYDLLNSRFAPGQVAAS